MALPGGWRRLVGIALAVFLIDGCPGDARLRAGSAADPFADCQPEAEPNETAEQAPLTAGDICFEGTLVEKADQDLWFWDVRPEDGLATWTFTVDGVPNATTSVHVIRLTSDDGVFPVATAGDATRADSDVKTGQPGVLADIQLPPDRYLLGVSRADAVGGVTLTDDLTYRFAIERHVDLPASADVEPNDDAASASPIEGLFDVSGDVGDGRDVLRWTLDEAAAARTYRLEARTTLNAPLTLELRSADGQPMSLAQRVRSERQRVRDARHPRPARRLPHRGDRAGLDRAAVRRPVRRGHRPDRRRRAQRRPRPRRSRSTRRR